MKVQFFKYQAMGNDMVVIDPVHFDWPLTPDKIRLICDRHFGLGADGICYGPLPDDEHPHKIRFFNPDGSEAEKSGNGLRIFARYLWDYGYVSSQTYEVWMNGIAIPVQVKDPQGHILAMEIGQYLFDSPAIPVSGPARTVIEEPMRFAGVEYAVTALSVGNPHCVIFVDTLSAAQIKQLGPIIETDANFPNRINVQLVKVIDRHTIEIEIWERGAGYTLASGTSASATAGAALKTGRCNSPVEVRMPGGIAHVDIDVDWQINLTGSVEAICHGEFSADLVTRF